MKRALELYRELREDLASGEVAELAVKVKAHYDHLLELQNRNELVAIDLAEQLCQRLEELLRSAATLTAHARAEVVGAARYFVSPADLVPDHSACIGLDDDVAVFNHVVRLIGRPELEIPT